MKVAVSRVHYPVLALGPGRRLGIWFQGCRIRCAGCVSRDTWETGAGRFVETDELLAACERLVDGEMTGVTISGGEPFDQPVALWRIVAGIRRWERRTGRALDVMAYSGYPLETLWHRHGRKLRRLDLLIPEPFLASAPEGSRWRGSSNQPLVVLSKLGAERLAADRETEGERRPFQVSFENASIWMIGIPRRGDLTRLVEDCSDQGLRLGDVSWIA